MKIEFPQPTDKNIKVWRYLSLPKLISLFEKKKLFIPRVDLLDDPFEGTVPISKTKKNNRVEKKSDESEEAFVKKHLITLRKKAREIMYVSCWYMGNEESEAMWRLYCGKKEGVSIQTRYSKLNQAVENKENYYIGLIEYINYEKEKISGSGLLHPFMYKRKAFEHEKEVRILYFKKDLIHISDEKIPKIESGPKGIELPIDFKILIDNVLVNPYAPDWYFDVVNSIIKKYYPSINVIRSEMQKSPQYYG